MLLLGNAKSPGDVLQVQTFDRKGTIPMSDLDTLTLPLLPLTTGVVLPGMVVTLTLESPEARAAVETGHEHEEAVDVARRGVDRRPGLGRLQCERHHHARQDHAGGQREQRERQSV